VCVIELPKPQNGSDTKVIDSKLLLFYEDRWFDMGLLRLGKHTSSLIRPKNVSRVPESCLGLQHSDRCTTG